MEMGFSISDRSKRGENPPNWHYARSQHRFQTSDFNLGKFFQFLYDLAFKDPNKNFVCFSNRFSIVFNIGK